MDQHRIPPLPMVVAMNTNGHRSPTVSPPPTGPQTMLKANGSVVHRQLVHNVNLNSSVLNSSKRSIGGVSYSSKPPGLDYSRDSTSHELSKDASRLGLPSPAPSLMATPLSPVPSQQQTPQTPRRPIAEQGWTKVQGALVSMALLSLVSVLVALLAVVFLLKVTPVPQIGLDVGRVAGKCNLSHGILDAEEYRLVAEVVIGLTTCTISLDLSCLLICTAQFLFAAKLMKYSQQERVLQYLQQSSYSRGVATSGFFISIPVLLTAIILYAFIHFESKPAIVTSLLLGLGIVFCGLAMIHNVYVWQKEKTKASLMRVSETRSQYGSQHEGPSASVNMMELSTLV